MRKRKIIIHKFKNKRTGKKSKTSWKGLFMRCISAN